MRGSCTPCPVKALARPPRAPWEKAPARSPNSGKCVNEESYGKIQGSAGEGRHAICRMPKGLAIRHDRSLGSHDAAELVGGICHGNGCRHETARLHATSCTKTGWSSLTHDRMLHQALARSLPENKVQFVVEDVLPFRERASGQNGRLNLLRTEITTEGGALFDNHPRLKNKALLLDINIANSCVGSIWGMQHTMQENTSPMQSSGRKTSIGARSPLPTPSFLSPCRLVVRLAQTCMPSSRSSSSDG